MSNPRTRPLRNSLFFKGQVHSAPLKDIHKLMRAAELVCVVGAHCWQQLRKVVALRETSLGCG